MAGFFGVGEVLGSSPGDTLAGASTLHFAFYLRLSHRSCMVLISAFCLILSIIVMSTYSYRYVYVFLPLCPRILTYLLHGAESFLRS